MRRMMGSHCAPRLVPRTGFGGMMTVRERIHSRERESLAPWASRSEESRGRATPEDPCPIRTDFQRDRDRVIHCRAFRRLAHKTQVFILPSQDHIRTRLTHTLEVTQIAKTLARALSLNEDLTEAIALAHDLGHTPFGHSGEAALDEVVKTHSERFYHWEQSLRVVDVLERNGRGLNLTWEVRQGILGHTKGRNDLTETTSGPATLESQAVKLADRIAYVNHDMEDAIRARFIPEDAVPESLLAVLGYTHSDRIGKVVADIVEQSTDRPEIRISPQILQALNDLKEFLFERVYLPNSSGEDHRVRTVVHGLFDHYFTNALEEIEDARAEDRASASKTACRQACDYVAGMTDRFAVQRYMELYVPDSARFVEN